MEFYRVWAGKRSFTGEGDFKVIEFVGEKIGIEADVYPGGMRGVNYHVFITESDRVLIYQHNWSHYLDDESEASLEEYASFDEAADAGFWLILMNLKITYTCAYKLDEWRATQRKLMRQ